MRKNSKLDNILYSIVGLIFFVDYGITIVGNDGSPIVFVTFLVIGILSYLLFVVDKEFLSVHKMIAIYLFIFGYLAPIKQYISHYYSWGWTSFSDDEYIFANILLIVFIALYTFAKFIFFEKVKMKFFRLSKMRKEEVVVKNNVLVMLTIVSIICLGDLIARGTLIDVEKELVHSDTIYAFVDKVLQFFPVASILFTIFEYKNGSVKCTWSGLKMFWFINGLISIVIFFPFNATMPRFLLFGVYIIICAALMENVKHNSFVLIAAAIGFYYIFPAFNFFKGHGLNQISEFALGGLNFNFVDYDAHHLFMMTIRYADQKGLLYGSNLITALLCMIPRSIWHDKQRATGFIVSRLFTKRWTNLSCPAYAEGYIAYGFIGVALVALIIGLIVRRLEDNKNNNSMIKGINCICIGMAIYWMRGAMLPTTAYVYALIASYMIVYAVCTIEKVFSVRTSV